MIFANKNFYVFWRKLYSLSLHGMGIGAGGSCQDDGEIGVLKRVLLNSGGKHLIVFDGGANIGKYTEVVHRVLGNRVSIHAFEPSKITYETLKANTADISDVFYNNFGLSNENETVTLYSDGENSSLASMYDRQLDCYGINLSNQENISVRKIDDYCSEQKIKFIDLLKLDIEGNELNALIGAEKMLEESRIGAIQIEFGGCNIDSRTYLRDFWNLLHERYNMYRVLSNGLYMIDSYHEGLELFSCQNFYFELKDR